MKKLLLGLVMAPMLCKAANAGDAEKALHAAVIAGDNPEAICGTLRTYKVAQVNKRLPNMWSPLAAKCLVLEEEGTLFTKITEAGPIRIHQNDSIHELLTEAGRTILMSHIQAHEMVKQEASKLAHVLRQAQAK